MPLRAIAAVAWRACAALLLALIVLVLGVSAYLGTKHGRARLARAVVSDLDRAIPGALSVRELERFSLTEVVIGGVRLRAPAGNDVLVIGRVRARLAPWSLLRGRFVVSELSLEDGVVDLRFGADARRSLSSALLDPRAPEAPEAPPASEAPAEGRPGLALAIEAARLDRWRARLPSGAGLPARDVEITTSTVHARVGPGLELEVEPTEARLLEQDREIGAFRVNGGFRSTGVSRLALAGELLEMQLALDLTLGAPGHAVSSWETLPFALELRASELTPARLRRLTAPPLRLPALAGSYAAELSLRGTPESLDGSGTVLTPAGPLTVRASARDLSRLQLDVRTERLALQALGASLPDWRVTSQIGFSLERERDGPPRLRIESSASASVDDHALPPLTLRAERAGAATWRLELGLHDRWLSLAAQSSWAGDGTGRTRARGWVSSREALALLDALGVLERWGAPAERGRVDAKGRLDASLELSWGRTGALDARATLAARALELGSSRLEQLAVQLALAGTSDGPRVRVDGHWRAAPRGSAESTPGRLELHGGPRRHRFELHSGSLGFGSISASGWHERENGARRFELRANGRYGRAPFRVAIHEARLLDAGQLALPRMELELCEQRFALEGRLAGADSELALELGDVDLGRLLQPFGTASELAGTLSGRVEARGDPMRPELRLSLRATRAGLRRRAKLDSSLDGTFDVKRGQFQVRASARESTPPSPESKPRLDVALDASGSILAGSPWPRALRAGNQRARLAIARLDSALLTELTGETLPASFDVRGVVDLRAERGLPRLAYELGGRLGWVAAGAPADGAAAGVATARSRSTRLKHSFRYDARRAETDLSLSDGLGPWLKLHADAESSTEHAPSLDELVRRSKSDWLRQLGRATWRLDADVQRRSLDGLPLPARLRRLSGGALAARLVARRDRDGPPSVELGIDIAGDAPAADEPGRSPGARCSSAPLNTRAELRLGAGRFEIDVASSDRGVQKLHLSSRGELDVAAWLRGDASRPRLDVVADATALPLERLPFVCDALRGELTAQARVSDVFGAAEASSDISIARFSLGSEQTVDVSARAALEAGRFELAGKVLASGRQSSFQIRLPRPAAAGGASAPREVSFELAELPLAPLVPLDGPISHASGRVSGSLRASAGGGAPQLSGKLRLDGVGLTLTELAQPLSDISGELSLRDGVLSSSRLSARDGDGRLELSGTLKLASARSFDARLELTAREFPLRQSGEVVAQTTATAKVDAVWRPERNRLRVELENFDTWLERREASRGMSLAPHPDLRVTPEPAAEREPWGVRASSSRAEPRRPTPLSVQIDAAQQFWVKRADFALELSADLDIGVEPAARGEERPRVSVKGQLRFNRGYMEMLGKTFEVRQGGLLRFTGGTSAVLDLTASYRDRRSSQLVVVHVQGSVESPKLDFSVDGEKVSAGEAFQAIYGSKKSSEDDVEPEAQASQILSALMAGVLTTSIRRKLGSMAPILSVDPADDDRGDQVRAGFELDALIPGFLRNVVTGVYVEGSVSSEKQSDEGGAKEVQTGVLIELYFPYGLVSSGRYGPDSTWSFDIGWQPRGH